MSFSYFRKLNYTLANEDTRLEMAILPESVSHAAVVAGSGARVLPLLSRHPRSITCIDLSREQLFLTELRFEACRALQREDYLRFFGYPPTSCDSVRRRALFEQIRLSRNASKFWRELFEVHGWKSILYEGKWERTFRKLARINGLLTGERGRGLFDSRTIEQQRSYYEERFPKLAWKVVLMILGQAPVFNALLYKGHFPSMNIPTTRLRFYSRSFDRLLQNNLARENYFLQLLFFGEIRFVEGNTVECQPGTYETIREALASCEICYTQGNVVEVVAGMAQKPVDFLSFSDVPSYFGRNLSKTFMQDIRPGLAPDALIVNRSYLHIPWRTDTLGYESVTSMYRQAIEAEKTQMYVVDVFRHISNNEKLQG